MFIVLRLHGAWADALSKPGSLVADKAVPRSPAVEMAAPGTVLAVPMPMKAQNVKRSKRSM